MMPLSAVEYNEEAYHEEALVSRWNSLASPIKIFSVGLILVYLLGLLCTVVLPLPKSVTSSIIFSPIIIFFLVGISLMIFGIIATICAKIIAVFRKCHGGWKTICLFLPLTIAYFIKYIILAVKEVVSDFKEEVIEK